LRHFAAVFLGIEDLAVRMLVASGIQFLPQPVPAFDAAGRESQNRDERDE
jgi:hypothetical protein